MIIKTQPNQAIQLDPIGIVSPIRWPKINSTRDMAAKRKQAIPIPPNNTVQHLSNHER